MILRCLLALLATSLLSAQQPDEMENTVKKILDVYTLSLIHI